MSTGVDALAEPVSPGSLEHLEISGVSKSYVSREGRVRALDAISLRAQRGQFVSIIGPTGCGKSTLLRIVSGLLEPDSGTVCIFGESPSRATKAKHIGFVPQSPALLPWRSVLDNVRLPFQVNRSAGDRGGSRVRNPEAILEAFGLGSALDRKPGQLSLGMQQRVAIARAFVFDPAVLVMDEPFSALDELTRERQRHELLDVWQSNQKTVLFVTHSVTEAIVLSDLVVVMSAQPGSVHSVVDIGLSRPRSDLVESTDAFRRIELQVRAALREAWTDTDG